MVFVVFLSIDVATGKMLFDVQMKEAKKEQRTLLDCARFRLYIKFVAQITILNLEPAGVCLKCAPSNTSSHEEPSSTLTAG